MINTKQYKLNNKFSQKKFLGKRIIPEYTANNKTYITIKLLQSIYTQIISQKLSHKQVFMQSSKQHKFTKKKTTTNNNVFQ